jgi:hypothetical protein
VSLFPGKKKKKKKNGRNPKTEKDDEKDDRLKNRQKKAVNRHHDARITPAPPDLGLKSQRERKNYIENDVVFSLSTERSRRGASIWIERYEWIKLFAS